MKMNVVIDVNIKHVRIKNVPASRCDNYPDNHLRGSVAMRCAELYKEAVTANVNEIEYTKKEV